MNTPRDPSENFVYTASSVRPNRPRRHQPDAYDPWHRRPAPPGAAGSQRLPYRASDLPPVPSPLKTVPPPRQAQPAPNALRATSHARRLRRSVAGPPPTHNLPFSFLLLLAFFCPPLAVGIKTRSVGAVLFNLILTLLLYIPGVLHAIICLVLY